MSQFYVYMLGEPTTGKPFYVGKGTTTRPRIKAHINEGIRIRLGKKVGNPFKARVIANLLDQGLEPTHSIVLETNDEDLALILEAELVDFYGRRNNGTGILTNLTDGGSGISGWHHTEEARRKISEASSSHRHSEETKQKIKEHALTRSHSEETKRKIGEHNRQRIVSNETRAKMSASRMGRQMSEAARAKMSEVAKNRIYTPERLANMSKARKGVPWTEARRQAQQNRSK